MALLEEVGHRRCRSLKFQKPFVCSLLVVASQGGTLSCYPIPLPAALAHRMYLWTIEWAGGMAQWFRALVRDLSSIPTRQLTNTCNSSSLDPMLSLASALHSWPPQAPDTQAVHVHAANTRAESSASC